VHSFKEVLKWLECGPLSPQAQSLHKSLQTDDQAWSNHERSTFTNSRTCTTSSLLLQAVQELKSFVELGHGTFRKFHLGKMERNLILNCNYIDCRWLTSHEMILANYELLQFILWFTNLIQGKFCWIYIFTIHTHKSNHTLLLLFLHLQVLVS